MNIVHLWFREPIPFIIPLRNLLQREYGITKCLYVVVKLKDNLCA